MKKYIYIKTWEGDEVVDKIDVTGKSERSIERIEDGININLDHELYYTTLKP